MGARGRVKTQPRQFPVRLDDSLYVQIKILSALESMSMATLVRTLLREALRARGPIPPLEGPIMSRKIDTTQPLSPEDEQYLATRGITAEKLADRQATHDLLVDAKANGDDQLVALLTHKIAAAQ